MLYKVKSHLVTLLLLIEPAANYITDLYIISDSCKVDVMLGAYMDDLSLQPEHLESALSQIQPSVRSAALQVI
jgi:hypothetical protein